MKTILLAVLGETPQILTEIIFAYYYQQPEFKFDRILILTTTLGESKIEDLILKPRLIEHLAATLKRPVEEIPFSSNDIIVFKNAAGEPLDDVRTNPEVQSATLQFYSTLQQLTADEQTQLIATIAGGRKNMGAGLALGLQLFGREQDRLIHVLVKKRHESSSWFYPQTESEVDDIEISEIPYIRIRSYLPNQRFVQLEPDRLLEIAQHTLDANAPIRSFIIRYNWFIIDDECLRLSPHQAMIIRYLARQKTHFCTNRERGRCGDCHACFVDIKSTMANYWNSPAYYQDYQKIASGEGFVERRQEVGSITTDQIRSHISKTKKEIQARLRSFRLQQNFQILSIPDPNETDRRRHLIGLSIDKNAITWDE